MQSLCQFGIQYEYILDTIQKLILHNQGDFFAQKSCLLTLLINIGAVWGRNAWLVFDA